MSRRGRPEERARADVRWGRATGAAELSPAVRRPRRGRRRFPARRGSREMSAMRVMRARKKLLCVAVLACVAPLLSAASGEPSPIAHGRRAAISDPESPTIGATPSAAPASDATPTPEGAPTADAAQTPEAMPTPEATPTATTMATAAPSRIPLMPGFEPTGYIDQLLIGDWQCQTFAGTGLTHEYSRGDDVSSLLVDTQVTLAGNPAATIHEIYQHHLKSHVWTAILENGAFVATAADSSGDTWTFTGQSTENGRPSKVRMIYTLLSRDAFRRDFQRADGVWSTYSGETCRRTS